MAKYPMRYPSRSKGPVEIEEMQDRHLLNALKKHQDDPDADPLMVECLREEVAARGLEQPPPVGDLEEQPDLGVI